ncbi:MAG: hypothetical protein HYT97_06335 [Elusimicrobia bacterium]|nr:hypothetical protein [Elusimicrobiota bacterium]
MNLNPFFKCARINKLFRLVYLISGLFILLSLTSCEKKEEETAALKSKFSSTQLTAHFSYDLGPATVDVSSYPLNIQESYKLFLAVCSSCHTSSRPLNSPYIKAYDWKRFIKRMHIKMGTRGYALDPKEEKRIVEFLVYDSKIRKIDKKDEFDAKAQELNKLFEEVSKERDSLKEKETLGLPKKETPYVGVK